MTLLETFLHFAEGDPRGIRGILQKIVQLVTSVNDLIPFLSKTVLAILGIAVCLVVGLFGYKLLKVISGLLAAYIGYTAGVYLTAFLAKKLSWFPKSGILEIGIGAVIGTLLFFLAFKQHKFFAAIVAGIVTYGLFMQSVGEVVFLSVGAALIVALLFMYFEKVFTILSFSFGGALLGLAFLNSLLPNVKLLYLYSVDGVTHPGVIGVLLGITLGLIFVLVQFLSNRYFDQDDDYRYYYRYYYRY